jgi:hypothetical protein
MRFRRRQDSAEDTENAPRQYCDVLRQGNYINALGANALRQASYGNATARNAVQRQKYVSVIRTNALGQLSCAVTEKR